MFVALDIALFMRTGTARAKRERDVAWDRSHRAALSPSRDSRSPRAGVDQMQKRNVIELSMRQRPA